MHWIRRARNRTRRKADAMSREIAIADIVDLASDVLRRHGLRNDEAAIVVAHLLDSELRGSASHGFYRIPGIVHALDKSASSAAEIAIERDTEISALVNGGGRLGLVAAHRAVELAMEKARARTMAVVGAYNYIGTTGAMGYYARRAADDDLVAIVLCNSEYAVAPTGGRQAILGTNPIAFGIPTSNAPIISDLATSAWSYGDLALAMQEGRRIPEGIVIDKDGKPSTDPHDADNGAQLPMAGHKGYALGLAIEVLAGPFVQAKAGRSRVPGSDGFLVMVIDPAIFGEAMMFRQKVSEFEDEIKSSPLAPGSGGILLPGERSEQTKEQNVGTGRLRISDSVLTAIEALKN